MRLKAALGVTVGLAVALVFPSVAGACSLGYSSPGQRVGGADIAIYGQVMSLSWPDGERPSAAGFQAPRFEAQVRVDRVFKGAPGAIVMIQGHSNDGLCGFSGIAEGLRLGLLLDQPSPHYVGTGSVIALTDLEESASSDAPQPRSTTVTGLRLAPGSFRVAPPGTTPSRAGGTATRVSYTLRKAAGTRFRVRFTIERATQGRIVFGGRCVFPTASTPSGKACTRYVRVPGSITRTRPAGPDRFTFTGRLNGQRLKPGRYRLVATATVRERIEIPARAAFQITR